MAKNRLPVNQTLDSKAVTADFLGTGWSFPPTFSTAGHTVVMTSDEVNIQQSLWVLLSTSLGDRIMLPTYGTQLWSMVFQNLTTTLLSQLQNLVQQAILTWEPRINATLVKVAEAPETVGLVLITIDYTIITTNTRSNMVYPFYLNEATIPAEGS